jgi:hypothetical protein
MQSVSCDASNSVRARNAFRLQTFLTTASKSPFDPPAKLPANGSEKAV